MFRDLLPAAEEFGIYQILAMLMFFIFFLVVVFRVFKMDKSYIHKMENLPLDKTNLENNLPGEKNDKVI